MSQHTDTVAAWLKEARDDLRWPTAPQRLEAVLRWTSRVANVKGALALADRALRQQEQLELSNRFRADGMPTDPARDLVLANGPSDIEMSRARADYSTAVELAELAERVCRLLERPRATKVQQQPVGKSPAQFGGRR